MNAAMRSDIRRRLYLVVGLMALNVAFVVWACAAGLSALSSLRAYVGGESLWAKHQKDALTRLIRYYRDRDEDDWRAFERHLRVPLGDRKARLALEKDPPDFAAAEAGFLEGGNHPDDVEGLCRLFTRFRRLHYMDEAIRTWEQGDALLEEMRREAALIRASPPGRASRETITRLRALNDRFTVVENHFSATLGEASRWTARTLTVLLVAGSLALTGLSVLAALLISGRIAGGIRELAEAAARAGQGDLSARIPAGSDDELGMLAASFNRMAESLLVKTRELESFSYSVAHDLRSPLGKIQGFARVLEEAEEKGDAAGRADALRRMLSAAKHMEAIIDGLLKLSRLSRQEFKLESVDLTLLARQEAEELKAGEPGRRVEFEAAPGLAARADEAFCRIILGNLLKNAWKFTGKSPSAKVSFGGEVRGGETVFWVRDDGAGFDPQHAGKLFTPFSRLHGAAEFPGTGIGLATVRRAVERHGGRIWAESEPGKGAAFFFTLAPKA
jgi:two-component system, sensor histidine kinase